MQLTALAYEGNIEIAVHRADLPVDEGGTARHHVIVLYPHSVRLPQVLRLLLQQPFLHHGNTVWLTEPLHMWPQGNAASVL